jgi:hypothetical protein
MVAAIIVSMAPAATPSAKTSQAGSNDSTTKNPNPAPTAVMIIRENHNRKIRRLLQRGADDLNSVKSRGDKSVR